MEEKIEYNASIDASMENRNYTEQLRNGDFTITVNNQEISKITGYKFKILIQDKPTLEGILSREDMELIYRSYSSEGSNLTQRTVARYFPNYTFQEFKKILRAFNITKACSPLAPHIIEESSIDKLIQLTVQQKENDYLRKLEQDRSKLIESKYKDLIKEHNELKNKFYNISEFFTDIEYNPKPFNEISFNPGIRTLIINLSDMHVGATVSSKSIYNNPYDEFEITNRLNKILRTINNYSEQFDNIIVFNLGDSLDGYNGETTRGGHKLPQSMDNKAQVQVFVSCMVDFFSQLNQMFEQIPLSYACVGESNHDGDFGWLANHKLATILEYELNVDCYISDYYIDNVSVGNTTFVLCHGKDNKDMFKNLPLFIDTNTENKINEYLDYNNISGNVVFIKGDLHQSAISYGKKFTYWSVGSLFGSSEWIHKNFGNTKATCDFGIVSNDGLITSRIILN